MYSSVSIGSNNLAQQRIKFCAGVGLFTLGLIIPLFSIAAIAEQQPAQYLGIAAEFKPGHGPDELVATNSLSGWEAVFPFSADEKFKRTYRAMFTGTQEELSSWQTSGFFEYINVDQPVRADALLATDPYFTQDSSEVSKQWWLAKINAPQAWELTRGSADVTVAVVDTGIDGRHEDLNDGRVGSGYVTYCQVISAVSGQCLVHMAGSVSSSENSDDNGHGTIVSGIIGAVPNNNKGIAGINWQVRLMPIKVLDSNGAGVSSDVAAGIVWAVDQGANIINLSLGGTSIESNTVLSNALSYAFDHGVLVVAAAGNDSALVGSDLDVTPVYPVCSDAGRNLVLGVAAVDMNDRKASFSNYGRACIDLTAPGTAYFNSENDRKGVLSTYFDPTRPAHNSLYVYASGTSMASPMVRGVAALLKSFHPDLSAAALRDRLVASTLNVDSLNQDTCRGTSCTGRLGAGRVDALKALQATTLIADSLITDTSGRTYLIDNGVRRVVSQFVFAQRGFRQDAIRAVAISEAETIPLGIPLPPLDGTLVKAHGNPTISSISGGVLLPASYLAFKSNGFNFAHVVALSDDEVAGYRRGPNLLAGNGALMKRPDNGAVFFIHEGRRRLISYFTFLNRGLKFSDVVEVEAAEFDRYPSDPNVQLEPPLDGALIKSLSDPTIYLVQDGQFHALSAASFAARNFSFTNVGQVPQSEIEGYIFGTPML